MPYGLPFAGSRTLGCGIAIAGGAVLALLVAFAVKPAEEPIEESVARDFDLTGADSVRVIRNWPEKNQAVVCMRESDGYRLALVRRYLDHSDPTWFVPHINYTTDQDGIWGSNTVFFERVFSYDPTDVEVEAFRSFSRSLRML